jgi:hypothetical protein
VRGAIEVVVHRREVVGSDTYIRFSVDAPLLLESDPGRSAVEASDAERRRPPPCRSS